MFKLGTICSTAAVDLAFMLDISSSINGEANLKLCISFIKALYASFTVSASAYHIGMVTFSASAQVVFDFSMYTSASEIDGALGKITLAGGSCSAGQGLSNCQSGLFAKSRSEAIKVLLVMIAGTSTDDVSAGASALKGLGVKIFCLGMGSAFQKTQLISMASMESYVLVAAEFSQLTSMTSQFVTLFGQVTAGKCLKRY